MAQLLTDLIAQICENYYKNIYKSNLSTVEMEDFFNSLGMVRSIGDVDQIMCDTPNTVLEVLELALSLRV